MSRFVRESPRHQIEIAVRVTCDTWIDYRDLYTTNLSRGGVFIASPLSAPIGTEMRVELSLPGGTLLHLRGEVVHLVTAAEAAESERPAGMGIMFLDLDEAKRANLEKLALSEAAPAQPRRPRFGDVVEQKLQEELARRLDLGPLEQLGVKAGADEAAIDEAHARLRERYAPTIFERYGSATIAVARNLQEVIDHARQELREPSTRPAPAARAPSAEELERKRRGEEARRALQATVNRRIEEACRLRDLDQSDQAARAFEQVLELDRANDYARTELRKLRRP